MKLDDVKPKTYISFNKENKYKDPDYGRISKYKNTFARGYIPNWPEEVFINKKVKNTVSWRYLIKDLNGEKII